VPQTSNLTPTSAHGALPGIHWDLSLTGYALIRDLKQSEAEGILQGLGGFIAQDGGTVRYRVKSTAAASNLSSSKSANALNPHTEASYHPTPPRFLALYCVCAAACGGGHTLLADGYEMLRSLGSRERETAMHEPIWFGDPTHLLSYSGPVFEPGPPPTLRFSYNLLRHQLYDPETAQIFSAGQPQTARERLADKLLAGFQRCHEATDIPMRGLLIIDNRRIVHGRTAYSDHQRELIRYWIQ
jgi:TfdA family taurine catabolism dioxygenase TauD